MKTNLIPSLLDLQQRRNFLCNNGMREISAELDLTPSMVKGVASFYSMFRLKPVGRHVIYLCTNIACMILGAESLLELLKRQYGLEPGGTTEDGRFSLVIKECIGACDGAPAMLVNEDLHRDLNESNIISILEGYK